MSRIIIALAVFALTAMSCNIEEDQKRWQQQEKENLKNWQNHVVFTIVHDSCEYVLYKENANSSYNPTYSGITHKGNCRFCKTRKECRCE